MTEVLAALAEDLEDNLAVQEDEDADGVAGVEEADLDMISQPKRTLSSKCIPSVRLAEGLGKK